MKRWPMAGGTCRIRALVAAALLTVGLLGLSPGCADKKKTADVAEVVSAERTYEQALAELEQNRLRKARALLERLQYTGEERESLEPKVRLAIADATFYEKYVLALIDARTLYLDFVTLYGQHERAPYAQFQAGMCSLAQVRHPAKDQTQTLQAITDFREVIRRFPTSPYAEAARGMMRRAEANLAEHEFLIGRFYMKRKKPLAAVERFRRILDDYPHHTPLDRVYFYLGQSLLRANNQAEARVYLDKLVTDYPNGRYSEEALKQLDKAGGRLEIELSGSP